MAVVGIFLIGFVFLFILAPIAYMVGWLMGLWVEFLFFAPETMIGIFSMPEAFGLIWIVVAAIGTSIKVG